MNMENKHLVWVLPLTLAVGILIGIFILPKNIDITFQIPNDTRDWMDEQETFYMNLSNQTTRWTNLCCYPYECEQAKNNPEDCTCIYPVYCGRGDDDIYKLLRNRTMFYNLTLVFKNV